VLESQEAVGYWLIQELPHASQRTLRNDIPEHPYLAVRVPLVLAATFVFLLATARHRHIDFRTPSEFQIPPRLPRSRFFASFFSVVNYRCPHR